MTRAKDKKLSKLSRVELLELLVEQGEQLERVQAELEVMENRAACQEKIARLAENAVSRLAGVLEAAQLVQTQYTQSLQELKAQMGVTNEQTPQAENVSVNELPNAGAVMPMQDAPAPQMPMQDIPMPQMPMQPVQEAPLQPLQDVPAQPMQDAPVQSMPMQDMPVQDVPVQDPSFAAYAPVVPNVQPMGAPAFVPEEMPVGAPIDAPVADTVVEPTPPVEEPVVYEVPVEEDMELAIVESVPLPAGNPYQQPAYPYQPYPAEPQPYFNMPPQGQMPLQNAPYQGAPYGNQYNMPDQQPSNAYAPVNAPTAYPAPGPYGVNEAGDA